MRDPVEKFSSLDGNLQNLPVDETGVSEAENIPEAYWCQIIRMLILLEFKQLHY